MSLAVDFFVSGFGSLVRIYLCLVGRQVPACYASLHDAEPQRRLLRQAKVKFTPCDDALIVVGEAAIDVAESLSIPLIPLLPDGNLPSGDPLARQVAAMLTEAIIPESQSPGSVCTFIPPAAAHIEGDPGLEFFARLVQMRGYDPVVMNPGHALALAELSEQQFTGIGLSLGAAVSSIAIIHRGKIVASRTLQQGSDTIDRAIAEKTERFLWDSDGNRYLDVAAIRDWKASLSTSLVAGRKREEKLLAELLARQVATIGQHISRLLTSNECRKAMPRQPLTLAVCGGTTRLTGFADLIGRVLRQNPELSSISQLRLCQDDLWTIVRGCLIAAEVETSDGARLLDAA